jgi:hypothetical protein
MSKTEQNANGQGTIFWSESRNRYVAQIHDLNGRRITKICKLKKDAQNWIQEQRQIREHGRSTNSANSKLTVTQFLNAWIETKKFRPWTMIERAARCCYSKINFNFGAARYISYFFTSGGIYYWNFLWA